MEIVPDLVLAYPRKVVGAEEDDTDLEVGFRPRVASTVGLHREAQILAGDLGGPPGVSAEPSELVRGGFRIWVRVRVRVSLGRK